MPIVIDSPWVNAHPWRPLISWGTDIVPTLFPLSAGDALLLSDGVGEATLLEEGVGEATLIG